MMTARQIRRAAERRQRKLEKKTNGFVFSSPDVAPVSEPSAAPVTAYSLGPALISPAQLVANRANSQLSTGPKTPEGKAKSSLNAVKTALTGRTVLLPSDDAATYQNHLREFDRELRPIGIREHALVQSLADIAWRLERIPALEMAIYAQGCSQFAQQFEHEDPALRPGLIELHTYLAYEKQLKNLHLQENRLRRQREKDTAELRRLQQERMQKEAERLEAGIEEPVTAVENGFEFSTLQIAALADPLPSNKAPNDQFADGELQFSGDHSLSPESTPAKRTY